MGVAACEIDGIARISPLEHVGDKRLPALIRWLMTEGEARPNGCIYTYTFLAAGGKIQPAMPNVLTTWTLTKSGLECWQSGLMQLSRKQSHCEVPEVQILHIPRWGSSTTPEGKCLPLVLACLVMKAADASVTATWCGWSCFMGVTTHAYGIGATGSMAVSKTVDVGSSPTCCAQPTHRLWERSSESSCGGSSFS